MKTDARTVALYLLDYADVHGEYGAKKCLGAVKSGKHWPGLKVRVGRRIRSMSRSHGYTGAGSWESIWAWLVAHKDVILAIVKALLSLILLFMAKKPMATESQKLRRFESASRKAIKRDKRPVKELPRLAKTRRRN